VDVGPTNHEAKARRERERAWREAGAQTLDLMNKNRVARQPVRGKWRKAVTPERTKAAGCKRGRA